MDVTGVSKESSLMIHMATNSRPRGIKGGDGGRRRRRRKRRREANGSLKENGAKFKCEFFSGEIEEKLGKKKMKEKKKKKTNQKEMIVVIKMVRMSREKFRAPSQMNENE